MTEDEIRERFRRRNDLFRINGQGLVTAVVAAGTFAGLNLAAGLPDWAALLAGLAVWVAGNIAWDMHPRRVPPDMRGLVAHMGKHGFRRHRRHPFLCTEKDPHVHLYLPSGPRGRRSITLTRTVERIWKSTGPALVLAPDGKPIAGRLRRELRLDG